MTEGTVDERVTPRTEAGRRLLSAIRIHAPWFLGGSQESEVAFVVAVEAEAVATREAELARALHEHAVYHRDVLPCNERCAPDIAAHLAPVTEGEPGALRALSEAATPGPWVADHPGFGTIFVGTSVEHRGTWLFDPVDATSQDAAFVAAAVNFVRAALSEQP